MTPANQKSLDAFDKVVLELQVKHGSIFKDHLKEMTLIRSKLNSLPEYSVRQSFDVSKFEINPSSGSIISALECFKNAKPINCVQTAHIARAAYLYALTAQPVTDDDRLAILRGADGNFKGNEPFTRTRVEWWSLEERIRNQRKEIERLRAATAPKNFEALVKALEEEIALIDLTILNIHNGHHQNQSATDIEVSVSRQKARLTDALAAHKAQGESK